MLSVHGLVKITRVMPLTTSGKLHILSMEVASKERIWNGEDRIDLYDANMYFFNEEDANMWLEQLTVDRILDVRWGVVEGVQLTENGKKGRPKVRLYPDIRHTVPK